MNTLPGMHRFVAVAFWSVAVAIILGAFGAHGLEKLIDEEKLNVWKTGVLYQMINSLGLLIICVMAKTGFLQMKQFILTYRLVFIGMVFFSLSIYLLSTREVIGLTAYKWLGPITPIGGTLMIAGWIIGGWFVRGNLKQ